MYRGFNLELSGIESEYQTYSFHKDCIATAKANLQDVDSEKFDEWIGQIPDGANNAKDSLEVLYKMFPMPNQRKYKVICG